MCCGPTQFSWHPTYWKSVKSYKYRAEGYIQLVFIDDNNDTHQWLTNIKLHKLYNKSYAIWSELLNVIAFAPDWNPL